MSTPSFLLGSPHAAGVDLMAFTSSLTITTNAVVASIKVPSAIGQFSVWHSTRLSKMLITMFRLWIADELTHCTLAQAAFHSDVDYALVWYLFMEGLVSTVGRGFCCRNEIMVHKKITIKVSFFKAWKYLAIIARRVWSSQCVQP